MPHPRPDNLPAIFGQYRLESLLGEGGMGCVFVGVKTSAEVHKVTMRRAIKVPHDFLLRRDQSFADSFFREARAAEAVQHDNVVRIHDVDVVDGVPFIAMDLLQGGPMDEVLAAGVLKPAHLIEVGLGMAAGLEAIHEAGLVHRDIKPGNVFLTRQGGVKLLDLGIARLVSGGTKHTRTGTAKGTPGYMAPEQLAAADIDARVDLFALGAVLSESILGEPVFSAPSLESLIVAMLRADEIVKDSAVRERIEARVPGMGDVVAGLLQQDPDARTGSAQEVVRQLREVRRRLPSSLVPAEGLRECIRSWAEGVPVRAEPSPPEPEPPEPEPQADGGTFELDTSGGGTRVLDESPKPKEQPQVVLEKTRSLEPVAAVPPDSGSRPAKRGGGLGFVVAGLGGCAALGLLGVIGLVAVSFIPIGGPVADTGIVVVGVLPDLPSPAAVDAVVFRAITGKKDGDPSPTPVPLGAFQNGSDGLQFFDVNKGSGPRLEDGKSGIVAYNMWLRDDKTHVENQPGDRAVGVVERAVGGMRAGGSRQVILPAALMSDEASRSNIPAGSDVVVEARLLSVRGDAPVNVPPTPTVPLRTVRGIDVYALAVGEGAAAGSLSKVQVEVTVWSGIGLRLFTTYDQPAPHQMTLLSLFADNAQGRLLQTLGDGVEGMRAGGVRVLDVPKGLTGSLEALIGSNAAGLDRAIVQVEVMSVAPLSIGTSLSALAIGAPKRQDTTFFLPPGGRLSCGGDFLGVVLPDGSDGNDSVELKHGLDVPLGGLGCEYVRLGEATCSGTVFQGKSVCRCEGEGMVCRTFVDHLLNGLK